jgi:hypothetical protein
VIRALVAVLAVPVLALSIFSGVSCGEYDRASMACCQGDAGACHQSGKTEGCCRKTPPEGRYAIAAAQGPGLGAFHGLGSALPSLDLLTSVAVAPEWRSGTLPISSLTAAPGPSPPLITVLRV